MYIYIVQVIWTYGHVLIYYRHVHVHIILYHNEWLVYTHCMYSTHTCSHVQYFAKLDSISDLNFGFDSSNPIESYPGNNRMIYNVIIIWNRMYMYMYTLYTNMYMYMYMYTRTRTCIPSTRPIPSSPGTNVPSSCTPT